MEDAREASLTTATRGCCCATGVGAAQLASCVVAWLPAAARCNVADCDAAHGEAEPVKDYKGTLRISQRAARRLPLRLRNPLTRILHYYYTIC